MGAPRSAEEPHVAESERSVSARSLMMRVGGTSGARVCCGECCSCVCLTFKPKKPSRKISFGEKVMCDVLDGSTHRESVGTRGPDKHASLFRVAVVSNNKFDQPVGAHCTEFRGNYCLLTR